MIERVASDGAGERTLPGDLIQNLTRFCRRLREEGVVVSPREEIDAARALLQIDLLDGEAFYLTLKTVLVVRRPDQAVFDRLFWNFWSGAEAVEAHQTADRLPRNGAGGALKGGGTREAWSEAEEAGTSEMREIGYSPEALLRKKSFDRLSPEEMEEMERLVSRLVLRLAARKRRRFVPALRKGSADLRRSFHTLLRYHGELLTLARREKKKEPPRIVLLCDVSGSMDPHSRLILRLLLSLHRVWNRAEIFVFNTALTHLTPLLDDMEVDALLEQIGRAVPDWSGGTQIGRSLASFLDEYGRRLLNCPAVVLIFSDGLDRGENDLLLHAMEGIRKRARKIIWMNPLLGDPDYEPLCRGMAAALPFVDHFAKGHNLEALEALVDLLPG